MNNLIAYMPVINRQYLEWLRRHQPFSLYLIGLERAGSLIPRLERNIIALSARDVKDFLQSSNLADCSSDVAIFSPELGNPNISPYCGKKWVMPDEDISRVIAEKYFYPNHEVEFEQVWARWDMTAVKRQEPVIPDLEVSMSEIDIFRINEAIKLSQKSPDWWRQIGALVFKGEELLACGWNVHLPTEYETYIFGDPRLNFDAGDPAGMDAYVSLHGEEDVICTCAKKGTALEGASWYVTDLPCGRCSRKIVRTGAKEVFFRNGYSMLGGYRTFKAAGVRIVKVNR